MWQRAGMWRGLEVAVTQTENQLLTEELASFVKEAETSALLVHRNVVATYSHDIRTLSSPTHESEGPEVFKFYLIQVHFHLGQSCCTHPGAGIAQLSVHI
jgi:hypothetical protein